MDLTPQQLVERKVAEIKRLAPIEPTPSFILGSLEMTIQIDRGMPASSRIA